MYPSALCGCRNDRALPFPPVLVGPGAAGCLVASSARAGGAESSRAGRILAALEAVMCRSPAEGSAPSSPQPHGQEVVEPGLLLQGLCRGSASVWHRLFRFFCLCLAARLC